MFCPSCGTGIPTRAAFCIQCGSSVATIVPAEVSMVLVAAAPPKTLNQIAGEATKFLGRGGFNRTLGWLALVVILFLLLVGRFLAVMVSLGQ